MLQPLWFRFDRCWITWCSSSAVFLRSLTLMPATGSSSIIRAGLLDEQHADLQPLLLTVAKQFGVWSSR